MKTNFKKMFAVALALIMVLSLAACSGGVKYTENNTEFVIGVSGPLTGGAAVYGTAVQNSAQMAVDEINAAGGLNGVMFKLVMTDDAHDATKVAANYASMFEGGMQVSLGTVTTGPGLEFSKLSVEDNVFFLTPSASGDKIPEYDNGYQMCFADGNQGKVAAEYVNTLGLSEIGVFYKSDDAYSNGIFEQFKENLDPSIATVEAVFTGDASDFSAQISTLKDCTFIFMPIYYQPASIFLTQAKGIIADDAVYYGCDGFDGLAGQFEDFSVIPQEVSMLSHFDSNATEGMAAEYIAKYTEAFGTETLNQFGASAYDCVYAIYYAMQAAIEAGETIDVTISASDLCDILKEQFGGGFSYSGVTGNDITWDENGYVAKGAVKYTLKEAN
ncbi:MAG: ABC transporter substrate-binding protein [Oscillospiraceae bacterium]|nr:ABC transporter substrate-binding protein [Oscillospiraceae bacterium]